MIFLPAVTYFPFISGKLLNIKLFVHLKFNIKHNTCKILIDQIFPIWRNYEV